MRDKMIKIGKTSDIPEGEGRVFRSGRSEIAIFHLDSAIFAVDNRCPHQSGPLADGIVAGDEVICPLHGHRFNLMTGLSVGDDDKIKTYPVFVEGEDLFIDDHI